MRHALACVSCVALGLVVLGDAQEKRLPAVKPAPKSAPKTTSAKSTSAAVAVRDLKSVSIGTMGIRIFTNRPRQERPAPEGKQWLQLRFTMTPSQEVSFTREQMRVADGSTSWPAAGFYNDKDWYLFDDLARAVKEQPPLMKSGDWSLPLFTLGSGQMDFSVRVKDEEVELEYGANSSTQTGLLFVVPAGAHRLTLRLGDLPPAPVPPADAAVAVRGLKSAAAGTIGVKTSTNLPQEDRAAPEGKQWLRLQFTISASQEASFTREQMSVTDGTMSWPAIGLYNDKNWYLFDDLVKAVKEHPPSNKSAGWALPFFKFGTAEDYNVLVKDEDVKLEYDANSSTDTGLLFLVPAGAHKLKLRLGDLPLALVPAAAVTARATP